MKSDEDGDVLAVVLEHADPSLTLPLFLTSQADEAVAEWRAWSEVLDVPLLLAEQAKARPMPAWDKFRSSARVRVAAAGAH